MRRNLLKLGKNKLKKAAKLLHLNTSHLVKWETKIGLSCEFMKNTFRKL